MAAPSHARGIFCTVSFGNWSNPTPIALSGTKAPFFAAPDTLTFTFAAPIDAFGIFIGGSGDREQQTLSITLSDGSVFQPFPNYSNSRNTFLNNTLFVGIVSPTPFTTVAFTRTVVNDFIDVVYFDDLSYRLARVTPVPAPAGLLVFGVALAGLTLAARGRRDAPPRTA